MDWLNYHHLFYFWTVANSGSVAAATKKLRLAQPTLSGQIRQLEKSLGAKLFARKGRGLILTEVGHLVFRYAEDIFTTGQELKEVLKGATPDRPIQLQVGVAMVIPKLVVFRLLEGVLKMPEHVVPVCSEDRLDRLLSRLSLHEIDVVLSDAPIPPVVNVRAYNHFLGECDISLCGTSTLKKKFTRNFPHSLNNAPMLLPAEGTSLRRSLSQWFEREKIQPKIIAEFQDSALLKAFGQGGYGIFPVPTMVEKDVMRQYRVQRIGRVKEVKEAFYAISVERQIKHPAVKIISEKAQEKLSQKPSR